MTATDDAPRVVVMTGPFGEIQRRQRYSVAGRDDDPPVHMVGAFAQLTTITRDAIVTKVIKRWPDLIGCPITP